jgi:hypothetical protein
MLAKGLPWPLFGTLLCEMALKSKIIPGAIARFGEINAFNNDDHYY